MQRKAKRKCREMARKKPNNKRIGQRRLKKMEAKRNPSHGKKWSLVWSPLNTYFGPVYPFFHEPEPWPILRALKVHFDQIWIFKLKSSFLKKKKTFITNGVVPFPLRHSYLFESITYFEWILNFQVYDGIIKKKIKKKQALGWKPQKGQSRVKMKAYC